MRPLCGDANASDEQRQRARAEIFDSSPYVRELGANYGIVDSITLLLIAEPDRVSEFGLSRHESCGLVTDQDLATLRLLAPHIRRSFTISDLLDRKSIETQVLGSALDNFAVGVVIVGDEGKVRACARQARERYSHCVKRRTSRDAAAEDDERVAAGHRDCADERGRDRQARYRDSAS